MTDQGTNRNVDEQSQVGLGETALPFSTPSSDKMLSRITILLFILVAGLLTVFGYFASSICITVILAGFLAILFDPVVVILEKLHLPRSVAAAGIVLAVMSLVGLLGYVPCMPPRKFPRFGCSNRQPGLIIWCAVWDLCGER